MNRFILLFISFVAISSVTASAQVTSNDSEPVATSELSFDAGDKIKGKCVCFPKGHPNLGTVIGTNISVNECCKRQSRTQQCNLTESGGRVWGCLDKKIEAEENF